MRYYSKIETGNKPMIRRSPAPWLPWLLGVLTILFIVNMTMSGLLSLHTDPQIAIIMIGLVAFIVTVEVPLQGDSISLGYAAGFLVYLSMGIPEQNYEAFGVMAIGGAAGGLLRAFWDNRESGLMWRFHRRLIERPLMAAAQLTLSLVIGDVFYRLVGGILPITELHRSDILPLAVLIGVSVVVYVGLYGLSVWSRGLDVREILLQNRLAIGLSVGVPLPFVITAALIFRESLGGFVILTIGLIVMAIGATALGRGRLQYRQQVVELQSLSAVNHTMRAYLDMNTLVATIQLQVATLLNVPNFTLALYDPNRDLLTFPLVVRHWQVIDMPTREMKKELIDYVITTKAPLLLSENPEARAHMLKLTPPESGPTSWLGVPLLAPDRALGGIAVALDDPYRRLTERDQRLLVTLATQASIAIENAQLYRQVQDRASQLNRLNNLAAELSGTLNPRRVLDLLVQSTIVITGAIGAAVFLWTDDREQSIVLARSSGLSDEFAIDPPLPISMGRNAQPLAVQNAMLEPQAAAVRDIMRRENISAWVELPLINGENQLGILISYYRDPRSFSGDEIELMRAFANQAVLSISNARLYQQTDEALDRRIEQLSALAAINKELSSTLNLNKVFNLVLYRAFEATKSNRGVLLLKDTSDSAPRLVASYGNTLANFDDLVKHPLVETVFAGGKPLTDIDTAEPRAPLWQLGVPLVRDEDVMGVIMLLSQSPDAYSPDNVDFVSQLATQAIIAVDNARLFEQMTASRNRLQVILDSMHEAVIMFDLDGRVALANPRVNALLSLDVAIAGNRLADLLAQSDLKFAERLGFDNESLTALLETLKISAWTGGGRLSYRLEEPHIRFLDRTIAAVLDQNNKTIGLLMVFADATEERELAQAREDLSRMIVHDLRSPLTAINASMALLGELASAETKMAKSIRKTTDISQRALRKLLHLVDSLLDIAKMESGNITLETEYVDLAPIAESVLVELSPLAEELDISVGIVMQPDLPTLNIDSDKIERVLLNLVDNALKFTPISGLVQIRARRDGNDKVRIEVCDNGPGVSDDYKKRIFDRFQQADQSGSHRRGTGLGLTFCRLTIEAHGGTIWIEDNPGGGSIFAFTLPVELDSDRQSIAMKGATDS
ncbi:MAG: GAF domain-containing protein [Chloroflexota bacterium]